MSKLIASTTTLEKMREFLINKYYYSNIDMVFNGSIWQLYNKNGLIKSTFVIKKKNKYSLEMI
jgi:hypothetical protein